MDENKTAFTNIDEYIAQYPAEIQQKLQMVRKIIHESAPDAKEKISWQMPTFTLHGNLIHFAAFKNHVGLYPGADAMEAFRQEMAEYHSTKGGVQLPYNKELPVELISRIVKFNVVENIREAESKRKAKK